MAVPMNSTQFRVIVEPILNEHFDGVYDQRKDEYKAIFKVKPRSEEHTSELQSH